MAMENVPPGYRFYPTEEELVNFYLRHKVEGSSMQNLIQTIDRVIKTMDVYDSNPWDLPQLSGDASIGDPEQWFFFVPKQESEIRGGRPSRLTDLGYWKATGSPTCVYSNNNRVIGVKRTMVFYTGRAPKGTKTEWKMNEYKLVDGEREITPSDLPSQLRDEYSLCRVYKKSKCLRAFDRRPTGDHPHSHCDQQNMNASSSSSFSTMAVERAADGSPEYSNNTSLLVDDDRQAQVGRSRDHQSSSSSVVLADDNDSVWDWEQLQWF